MPVAQVFGALGLLMLSGCNVAEFNPKGAIGEQERTLIITALGVMLLVVIPVIVMTFCFAWRYRASNPKATYAPKWAHSTSIEVVVWTIPCLIVAFLGVLIYGSTHTLDPYRPLESAAAPVRVEVIALNWKWLFIYPDYGVASVNRLMIPVDRPVNFMLTSDSIMNSFFIPQLGSQIYTMAGMQTQLHLIADTVGTYAGESSNFSGPGFSDMHFDAIATTAKGFDDWIQQARKSPLTLNGDTYRALTEPSSKNPVTVYAGVTPGLFETVVDRYMTGMKSSQPSMKQMGLQHINAKAAE
jgi:cytochrome o ubiquinol oxidase subunit II